MLVKIGTEKVGKYKSTRNWKQELYLYIAIAGIEYKYTRYYCIDQDIIKYKCTTENKNLSYKCHDRA